MIYIPHGEPATVDYYQRIASEKPHLNLDVQVLPPNPGNPHFVKSLVDGQVQIASPKFTCHELGE